jgi:hypothetical protein
LYGGIVPVAPETFGELIVDRSRISDDDFLRRMEARNSHLVLPEGTRLLVRVAVRNWKETPGGLKGCSIHIADLFQHLALSEMDDRTSEHCVFVDVFIGPPDQHQKDLFNTQTGGLYLLTRGPKAIGLASTQIRFPDQLKMSPVSSLNHAYTRLSEEFETWRISHTGNIYKQVYYQERNGKWHPLEILRNRTMNKEEAQIAAGLWNDFMARMKQTRASEE